MIQPDNAPVIHLVAGAVVNALVMLGSLTIPLSLLIIGAQLGELTLADHAPTRQLFVVILSRLVLAPMITIAIVLSVERLFGVIIPDVPRVTGYLIACMPVAVTCSIFIGRFGGDVLLGARTIFYSMLCSLLTVPLWYYVILRFGW